MSGLPAKGSTLSLAEARALRERGLVFTPAGLYHLHSPGTRLVFIVDIKGKHPYRMTLPAKRKE